MISKTKKSTFCILFFIGFLCLFISCSNEHVTGYNSNIKPKGVKYTLYQNGSGTSHYKGAMVFNVHSNNGLTSNEYYQVQVEGYGIIDFPSDTTQLMIPDVWPGYYNFTITIGCSAGSNATNSNCYLRVINGTVHTMPSTTASVDAYL
jgi:hypothetical protein